MEELVFDFLNKYVFNTHILNEDNLADIFIISPIMLLFFILFTALVFQFVYKGKKTTQRLVVYSIASFVAPYAMLCYFNFCFGLFLSFMILLFIFKAKKNEIANTKEDTDDSILKKEKIFCLTSFFIGIFIWSLIFIICK